MMLGKLTTKLTLCINNVVVEVNNVCGTCIKSRIQPHVSHTKMSKDTYNANCQVHNPTTRISVHALMFKNSLDLHTVRCCSTVFPILSEKSCLFKALHPKHPLSSHWLSSHMPEPAPLTTTEQLC